MLDLGRLKSIGMLGELDEKMLKKVGEKARVVNVKAGHYIFREGDPAEKFYSVLEGKVVLEISQNSSSDFKIKDILPTRSFGISSLVDSEVRNCVSHAKTAEDTKLLVWNAADLEMLFEKDFDLGYLMIKKVAKVLKDRLRSMNMMVATGV